MSSRSPASRGGSIPGEEIEFHPHSFADPAGRVFRWQEHLYRGLRAPSADFFAELARRGTLADLVQDGLLVDFEPTELRIEGFDLVMRHPAVPFPSYPHEWSCAMLRDATLVILTLAAELAERGLTLKDSHPWNVLFRGSRPVWVDLTSVGPRDKRPGWPPEREFRRFCVNPLILMASGHDRIARYLLPDKDGVSDDDLVRLAGSRSVIRTRSSRLRRRPGTELDVLAALRREVEALRLQSPPEVSTDPAPVGADDARPLLEQVATGSVLEIDPSSAWLARPAEERGWQTAWACSSAGMADGLYRLVRGSAGTLPLVVDFVDPTPRRGIQGHWQLAATDRLRADAVVSLDHARTGISPDQRAAGLAAFANGLLVAGCASDELAHFERALATRFARVRVVTSAAQGAVLAAER